MTAQPEQCGDEPTVWTPEYGAAIGEQLAARILARLAERKQARRRHGLDHQQRAAEAAEQALAAPW